MLFICHSVLLMVHLLSFIRAICPAHFHFTLVTYWTMFVTLVLCLMMVSRILSFSLTFSIFLHMAGWLVSRFFTNAFVFGIHFISGRTHWLKTFLFRLKGRCLARKISLYFSKTFHLALFSSRLLALFCFPLLLIVPYIYS